MFASSFLGMAACMLGAMVSYVSWVTSFIVVWLMRGQCDNLQSAWSHSLGSAASDGLAVSVRDASPSTAKVGVKVGSFSVGERMSSSSGASGICEIMSLGQV